MANKMHERFFGGKNCEDRNEMRKNNWAKFCVRLTNYVNG